MKKILLTCVAAMLSVGGVLAQIKFEKEYATAVARAAKERKPLFVAIMTRGSDFAKTMADEVFVDAELDVPYNTQLVPVMLWDGDPVAKELLGTYTFSYLPAYLLLSPEGDLLNKGAGVQYVGDMLAFLDKRLPQSERLAGLRELYVAGKIDRDGLREYVELCSQMGIRNEAALEKWLSGGDPDEHTLALVESQNVGVGSAAFRYVADHREALARHVGMNKVDLYIYNRLLDAPSAAREKFVREREYPYADALAQHVAFVPLLGRDMDNDEALQARLLGFVEKHPIAAPALGLRIMRFANKKTPAFDHYVYEFAGHVGSFSPETAVRMGQYLANNYLKVYADVVIADRWVDLYLRWGGDVDPDPQITKFVKQATGAMRPDDYGKEMPDITLRDLEGREVKVSDLRGGFVLIDFWASWCGPCRNDIPHVKAAFERVQGAPVQFVSISSDHDDAAWHKAVEEEAVPWLNLSSKGTTMLRQYGVKGIPRIMVLDPEGRLVADNITGRTVEMQLRRLAKEYGWSWQ